MIRELHAALQIQMEINNMQTKSVVAAHQRLDELVLADEETLRRLRVGVSVERMKNRIATIMEGVEPLSATHLCGIAE